MSIYDFLPVSITDHAVSRVMKRSRGLNKQQIADDMRWARNNQKYAIELKGKIGKYVISPTGALITFTRRKP